MKNYAIHTRVYFAYFESKHVYESINEEYPLFINSGNVASFENEFRGSQRATRVPDITKPLFSCGLKY